MPQAVKRRVKKNQRNVRNEKEFGPMAEPETGIEVKRV